MRGRCTLWLGPDHLLHVRSFGASEEYKRFYYAEVQALSAYKTQWGKFRNIVLLLFILLFVYAIFTLPQPAMTVFGVLGFFLVLLLIYNIARGPSCRAYVRTAVQREELPSLSSYLTYRLALSRIKPRIEAVQGVLEPAALGAEAATGASQPPPAAQRTEFAAAEALPGDPRWHRRLFFALLADGLVGLSVFYTGLAGPEPLAWWSPIFRAAGLATTILVAVFALTAVIRQQDTDLSGLLKKLAWAGLGYVCLDIGLAWFFWILALARHPASASDAARMFSIWTSPAGFLPEWFQYVLIGLAVLVFVLAGAGMIGLRRPRERRR
jgi:hypothetical protein